MSKMLFKPGGPSNAKWKGIGYVWIIIPANEVDEYVSDGWLEHPDDLLKSQEDEPRRGRKNKAVPDESDNEE